MFTIAFKRGH